MPSRAEAFFPLSRTQEIMDSLASPGAPNATMRKKCLAIAAFRMWCLLNLRPDVALAALSATGNPAEELDPFHKAFFSLVGVLAPEIIESSESIDIILGAEKAIMHDMRSFSKFPKE